MNPSAPTAVHSGIVTSLFDTTCAFYAMHFGFDIVERCEDYVLLGRADGARLGVLRAAAAGQPAVLQASTRGAGHWLAMEVEDPDALHERLMDAGVEIVADPEYTISGRRRCIARDPNGVLLYITQRPTPATLSQQEATEYHDQDHRSSVHRVSSH